jgi:hypothetical protein
MTQINLFWQYAFPIISICILLISAILIILQINKNHDWNRRQQSSALVEKFTSESMRNLRYDFEKKVGSIFSDELISWGKMDFDAQDCFRTLTNYFEDLGINVYFNVADEEILFAYFDFILPRFYHKYKLCIDSIRSISGNTDAYQYFEGLAKRWIDRKAKKIPGKSPI